MKQESGSNEPESKRVSENPTQSKKQRVPTEPVGETTKEPEGASRIKMPEKSIHSEEKIQETQRESVGGEPVLETSK